MLSMRLYSVASVIAAAGIITKFYLQHNQYYPTVVALAQSKAAALTLINLALLIVIVVGRLLKSLFLGPLRDGEILNLQERLWTTAMETLLSMTIFHDEFTPKFFVLMGALFGLKVFHWLAADRVDYFARSLNQGIPTYLRIFSLMSSLLLIDVGFAFTCGQKALNEPPSMMIYFGFEFAILSVTIITIMGKFFLNLYDLRQQGRWDQKSVYLMYLDFVSDIAQVILYVCFFALLMINYGMPLHLMRSIYFTFRSFFRRIELVLKYHRATRDMDRRFPLATPQQLQDADVCIVCREPMEEGRVMPCSHIMHGRCLLRWLERSQSCPICRHDFLGEDPNRHLHPGAPQPQQPQPPQPQPPGPQPNQQQPFGHGLHPAQIAHLDRDLQRMFGFQPQHPQPHLSPFPSPVPGAASTGTSTPSRTTSPHLVSPPQSAANTPQLVRESPQLVEDDEVLLEQVALMQSQLNAVQEQMQLVNALLQSRPQRRSAPPTPFTSPLPPRRSPPPSPSRHTRDYSPPKSSLSSSALSSSTPISRSSLVDSAAGVGLNLSSSSNPLPSRSPSTTTSPPPVKIELNEEEDPDEIRKRRVLKFSSSSVEPKK